MAKKCEYVRVIASIKGGYRCRGESYNVRDMSETADLFDNLRDADLENVKQIRIVPMQVEFTKPKKIATKLDGAKKSESYSHW